MEILTALLKIFVIWSNPRRDFLSHVIFYWLFYNWVIGLFRHYNFEILDQLLVLPFLTNFKTGKSNAKKNR